MNLLSAVAPPPDGLRECSAEGPHLAGRCDVTAYLRLLSFFPAEVGTVADQFVREAMVPGLRAQADLRHVYAGRAGPDDVGERVVVSVWESPKGQDAPVGLLDLERSASIARTTVEAFPLILSLPFKLNEEARILRVFRGQARPGELELYVAEARDGTYADVAAAHGPVALFLGIAEPDRFITVSIWTAWDNIEAATGGDLRTPVATRHAERLVSGTATHYEIVPGTALEAPSGA
jgi:hypothetical protein